MNVRKGDSGGRQEVAEIRAAREVTMAVQIGTPPLQGCFFLGWSRHLKELMCLINILQMQSETEMRKKKELLSKS